MMGHLFTTDALHAKRRGVDDEAYKLATHFLQGEDFNSDEARWALAGAIQEAVEDFCAEASEKCDRAREGMREDLHDERD